MASAVCPKYSFKVIVIGDAGVGKSALLVRFAKNCFSSCNPTIGTETLCRDVNVGDYFVRLIIWDTAGEERFRAVTRHIYRETHAVILMYSTTNIDTFNSLQSWMEEIKEYCPDDVKVFLVGGKADLEDERQVIPTDVSRFAKSHHLDSINTSAKTNLHVTDLFERIAETLAIEQETKSDSQTEETAGSGTVSLTNPSNPSKTLSNPQSQIKSRRKCC